MIIIILIIFDDWFMEEKMGRDNNNAGIHLVPKGYNGRTDMVDTFDRYGAMIAENRRSKKEDIESLLSDIELCNFIDIVNKRGERKKCLCGGALKYEEKLMIRFHHNRNMVYFEMTGKQCKDCERKLVVRNELCEKLIEAKSKLQTV